MLVRLLSHVPSPSIPIKCDYFLGKALPTGSTSAMQYAAAQAYYVIKAAQEREELQREGDALDARIQTAEKEVRGLEATLAKLNLVNTDMGRSFR